MVVGRGGRGGSNLLCYSHQQQDDILLYMYVLGLKTYFLIITCTCNVMYIYVLSFCGREKKNPPNFFFAKMRYLLVVVVVRAFFF